MLHVFAEADEIARDLKIIYLYIYIHLMHRSLSQSCDQTVNCLAGNSRCPEMQTWRSGGGQGFVFARNGSDCCRPTDFALLLW